MQHWLIEDDSSERIICLCIDFSFIVCFGNLPTKMKNKKMPNEKTSVFFFIIFFFHHHFNWMKISRNNSPFANNMDYIFSSPSRYSLIFTRPKSIILAWKTESSIMLEIDEALCVQVTHSVADFDNDSGLQCVVDQALWRGSLWVWNQWIREELQQIVTSSSSVLFSSAYISDVLIAIAWLVHEWWMLCRI